MNPREEVPVTATPPGEADPLWFAERQIWTDRMLAALRNGGPAGGRWYSLHDKVFCERTLRAAYARVAANAGAPGVDGMDVGRFGRRLDEEIARILADWQAERFRPQAVKRVWIPKAGSHEKRPLGIPTVRDRVVQAALRMVCEPIFEMDFHDRSHGFRPGRKAHDALLEVTQGLRAGRVWVVDADLKGYFDSIPHGPLLRTVQRRITDSRILGLLEQYLKAGVMEDGGITEPKTGSPQGGVISPLLANIYLNDLDHLMAQAGWQMSRYADDFVILCSSREEAEAALSAVRVWTVEAGLALHPQKTRIVDMGQPGNAFDFLGFRLMSRVDPETGQRRTVRLVRPKSLAKITDAIRLRTRRTNGHGLDEIITEVNVVVRGWSGYFRSAARTVHRRLDQTIRRRLRAILAKRRGTPNWGGGGPNHRRWPNAFFSDHGLYSLVEAHDRYRQSC